MKNKTHDIRNEIQRMQFMREFRDLPLDSENWYTIYVVEGDEIASSKQYGLYWLWVTESAKEWGNTKKDQHLQFKREHLIPIKLRDDKEFAKTWHQCKELNEPAVMDLMIKLTTISRPQVSMKQMHEYLKAIEESEAHRGLMLPHPTDLYYEALAAEEADKKGATH